MSVFTWLLAGGLVGWGACAVMGTPSRQAFIFNAVVAAVGAAVGLWVLQSTFYIGPGLSILALLVGAVCGTVLLAMVHFARLRIIG
jgi:uncharacterized membrane protein YeaQ/YmgE (transglycosylase-associated protein family)